MPDHVVDLVNIGKSGVRTKLLCVHIEICSPILARLVYILVLNIIFENNRTSYIFYTGGEATGREDNHGKQELGKIEHSENVEPERKTPSSNLTRK